MFNPKLHLPLDNQYMLNLLKYNSLAEIQNNKLYSWKFGNLKS